MKWNWLPPFLPLISVSNPYPQSMPSKPTIGKKMRAPTPALRLIWNGLNFSIESQQFPPSRNASAKMVLEGCRMTG